MWKVFVGILFILSCVVSLSLASRDPREWRIQRRAYDHELVTFYVALHQRNIAELEVKTFIPFFVLGFGTFFFIVSPIKILDNMFFVRF